MVPIVVASHAMFLFLCDSTTYREPPFPLFCSVCVARPARFWQLRPWMVQCLGVSLAHHGANLASSMAVVKPFCGGWSIHDTRPAQPYQNKLHWKVMWKSFPGQEPIAMCSTYLMRQPPWDLVVVHWRTPVMPTS